ncbi:MAG: hypothetical protein H7X95_07600, partial [Deltaproteobacteria bacterium]|nr:hypothetical protein [Deltaproteobacteria bacterium]
ACGKSGLEARLGDIRYNTVLNIPKPQTPSYWGIMVDGDDPLTGEKVVGSINIWTGTTDLAAQHLVDLVRYMNGEISTAQITNGANVQNWATAAKLSAGGGQGLATMSRAEIDARLASSTKLDGKSFEARASATPSPELRAALNVAKLRGQDAQARNDIPSPGRAKLQATLNLARGSAIENQLINPAMLQLAGASAHASSPGSSGAVVSPLGLNNPLVWSRFNEMRENALAARGACLMAEAPEPSGMTGLADIMAKKFPPMPNESPSAQQSRYDRMFQYVQRRYQYAIIAHEMGHSIGLRHNFVSTSAAHFYRPQYWQLRTKNGQAQVACTDAVNDGGTCVGPRYWDPVTDEEQSQMISMWMHSTVMDYPGDVSQDLIGLAITDFAAARFFYGDNVSVYTNPSYQAGTSIGTGITLATDTFGGLMGIQYGVRAGGAGSSGVDNFHYAQLQKNYQVIKDCRPVTPRQPATWNEGVDGKWNQIVDGLVVSVGGQATKCRQQPVDYIGYSQLRMPTEAETHGGFYRGGPSVVQASSGPPRLRVPYAFASDNWADTGNVSVLRHDNGADPYEQVQFLITTKENRHIFDNYRRNRTTFSLLGAASRSFNRYNVKLQGIAGGMGFFESIYKDFGASQGFSFDTLWPYIAKNQAHDNMIAATVAFDHFARELTRPEPGQHYRRASVFQDPVLRSATDPDDAGPPMGTGVFGQTQLVIPNGTTGFLRDLGFGGHPLENRLSTTHGDFDVEYIENAGSYYDKINTAILLAESEDRFVSQSRKDFYDARFRAVGLADVVPDGFRRLIANALTGDRSILAPRVQATAAGQPILDVSASTASDPMAARYPKGPLGWPSFWPSAGPEICFASQGRNACTNYTGGNFAGITPTGMAPIDPQIGWEVQKFLMTWTVALIKANEKTNWTDMMRIWRLGQNTSPEIEQRIEWQDPISGEIYYARDIGSECLFGDAANNCAGGKVVQKGIAARVLEYANQLTAGGYKLDVAKWPAVGGRPAGFNSAGRAMVLHHPSGLPIVAQDPAIRDITPEGALAPIRDCDQNVDPACVPLTIDKNHWAHELQGYKSVPDYLWQAELVFGWFSAPSTRGVF